MLDIELNNASIHRLVDWDNVNTSDETVSLWRKFKKATTRAIISTYRAINKLTTKKKGKAREEVSD